MIADSGGKVSIAPGIEMQMRHPVPPFQAALDHGIHPSLSVDVECNMTADMFSIMRAAFTLQRALLNERALAGEKNLPRLLTSQDTLGLATIEGARSSPAVAAVLRQTMSAAGVSTVVEPDIVRAGHPVK